MLLFSMSCGIYNTLHSIIIIFVCLFKIFLYLAISFEKKFDIRYGILLQNAHAHSALVFSATSN